MDFELLDHYLLDGKPDKAQVVRRLTEAPAPDAVAAPFYEGMRLLGARTPDLTLIALRLVLSAKKADDATVTQLRDIVARARDGDAAAREEFYAICSRTSQAQGA